MLRYDKEQNKIFFNDVEYKMQGKIITVSAKENSLVVVVNEFGHINMYQISEEDGEIKCLGIGVS
nr:MAG TPA: hypothetical protein [Caudoviricetes sp.]